MKKSYIKIIGNAMITSLVLTISLPITSVGAASMQITRIGEEDSYATAAKVATLNWNNPKDVVLVCGEGYADAVSATVLAKKLDAPILLTTSASFNKSAKDALDTLKPKNIYIIGGNASISKAVRDELKNSQYNLIELSGKDRYQTNIAVANQLIKLGVDPGNVILVGGEGFSDTLSITSVAASKDQILLLGNNNKNSMKPVFEFVKANNSKVTIVGTTYSISEDVYNELGAIKRIDGGTDRFDTNLRVLNEFKSELNSEKIFIANAAGDRYADALIASSLAGKWRAPLILTDNENSSSTDKAISYINNINDLTELDVVGNSETLSDKVIAKISFPVPRQESPTVKSVITNGLNQVKIVFNTDVDKSSAETLSNYQIDGADINKISSATATLQEDYRTLVITFGKPFLQFKGVVFKVKDNILDKKLSNGIIEYDQKITFYDTAQPIVESVTPKGGNKLIVKFSEPVRMAMSDLSSMKINRQSIDNYDFDESHSFLHGKSDVWSDKVELYFSSALPEGNNTFTVPNGEVGKKFDDAAGFCIKGTSIGFNITPLIGQPKVTDVKGDSSGNIYITYDREMDEQTALKSNNYQINGTVLYVTPSDISFEEGSKDKVVKIKKISRFFKDGDNEVIVKDGVKDTYGNETNETKMSFVFGNNNVKPQVSNVTLVDSNTIRIKFNKDVSGSYATSKLNYLLTDQYGTDITYKIDTITAVFIDGNNKRTFDIKFKDKDALMESKYTLTIKNIIDTSSKASVIDTYTASVYGLDDDEPNIIEIVKKANKDRSVVIFFNKTMDQETIINPNNYQFEDGNGNSKRLPIDALLTAGIDGKSVTIDFPYGYIIGDEGGERHVVKVNVSNVKDKYGNLMEKVAYSGTINISSSGLKLVDGTSKITYDGDSIKIRCTLTAPLELLNINDFSVNGESPDYGTMIDKDVILTFKDRSKVEDIKNAGGTIRISIHNSSSIDAAGRKIQTASDKKVYIPVITVPEYWSANSGNSNVINATVSIVFNQEVDNRIQTSYYDDFIFTNESTGQRLSAAEVNVDGKNIVFKFGKDSIMSGDKITVRASSQIPNINIRGNSYSEGNYSVYNPTNDDLLGRTLIAH